MFEHWLACFWVELQNEITLLDETPPSSENWKKLYKLMIKSSSTPPQSEGLSNGHAFASLTQCVSDELNPKRFSKWKISVQPGISWTTVAGRRANTPIDIAQYFSNSNKCQRSDAKYLQGECFVEPSILQIL